MQTQILIFSFLISLSLLVTVSIAIAWLFKRSKDVFVVKNHSKSKDRPVFREDSRRKAELKPDQQSAYAESQKLIEQGNFLKAAALLESIGLIRDAVDILEKKNQIKMAADILMRINKPDRAGIIFARALMWKEAVQCFIEAGLPEEVAKCSKLAGDYETAALYFEKAKCNLEAAGCYEKRARYRDAFRCFKAASNEIKAFEMLKLEISSANSSDLRFNKDELSCIEAFVSMGEGNDQLIRVLEKEQRIGPLFDNLLEKKLIASAIEIYKKSAEILQKQILEDIQSDADKAVLLLEFLQQLNDQQLLAEAFKKLAKFKAAAVAFENSSNLDMALSCYKELNDKDEIQRITKLISNQKSPNIRRLFPQSNTCRKHDGATRTAGASYHEAFAKNPIFAGLSEIQLQSLWSIGSVKNQRAGTQVLMTSKNHEDLIVVLEGVIESCDSNGIYIEKFGRSKIIATQALLREIPRKLSYHVTEDVIFSQIKIPSLQSLMDSDGIIARKIYQNLIRQKSKKIEKAKQTV